MYILSREILSLRCSNFPRDILEFKKNLNIDFMGWIEGFLLSSAVVPFDIQKTLILLSEELENIRILNRKNLRPTLWICLMKLRPKPHN